MQGETVRRPIADALENLATYLENGPSVDSLFYALSIEQAALMSASIWRYASKRDASTLYFDKWPVNLRTLAWAVEDIDYPINGVHHFAAGRDRVELIVSAIREQISDMQLEFKDRLAAMA